MKKHLLFTICSFILTIPIYSWLLYKATSESAFTQSDMWTSIIVPLYVIGWTSSREKGFSAYDLFLLTAAICTALDIYLHAQPSIFLLITTLIGTLILPLQYIIRAAKKQE
ncbi:hypothetical protein [Terribacillus sp. AE2B 122]|uniref:hypothetical protein n=1 Tax=Terribacillus TaxID=459532 RepID=UPI001583F623|nr:hypothetical protein [Terribacillus sp. AE2B 122]